MKWEIGTDVPFTNESRSKPKRGTEGFVTVQYFRSADKILITGFSMYASMTSAQVDELVRGLRAAQSRQIDTHMKEDDR
jgi:hypothetical protein